MKTRFATFVLGGIYVVEGLYAGFIGFVDLQLGAGLGGALYVAGALILLGAAGFLFADRGRSYSLPAIALASAVNLAVVAAILKNWIVNGAQGQADFYVIALMVLILVAAWPLAHVMKLDEWRGEHQL